MKTTVSLLVLLVFTSFSIAQEQDPPLERGFSPDKAYAMGDLDSIDLSSGNLSIVIPVGSIYPVNGGLSYGFSLKYSSQVWNLSSENYGDQVYTRAEPSKLFNAGIGWTFSLGGLLDPEDGETNPNGGWRYISPDGGEHEFFGTLHGPQYVQPDANYWYTRDGSYLRLRRASDSVMQVERPDGSSQSFFNYTGSKWRLTRTQDRFENYFDVLYDVDAGGKLEAWRIKDSLNREHYVHFRSDGHVDYVDVMAFGDTSGQRTAHYQFSYAFPLFHRHCQDDSPNTTDYLNENPTVAGENTWPVLASVSLADDDGDSTFTFGELHTECQSGPEVELWAVPGVIGKMHYPTGGGVRWRFKSWRYHSVDSDDQCPPPPFPGGCFAETNLDWAGVHERTLLDGGGSPIAGATWTYETDLAHCPWCGQGGLTVSIKEERRTVVSRPDGNSEVHYFRAYPGGMGFYALPLWEYSLPFTRRVQDPDGSGRFLSMEVFQGPVTFDNDDNSQGNRVRSVYRQFRYDEVAGYGEPTYRGTNRHQVSERTVFHDDSNVSTTVLNNSFDGVGHFRESVTSDTFGSGGWHRNFVGYNPGPPADPYPTFPGTFVPPATGDPWVLESFDAREEEEPAGVKARTEYCFEAGMPFMTRTRILKLFDGKRSEADIVVDHQRDSNGNVTRQRFFGADVQQVSKTLTCDQSPASEPRYTLNNEHPSLANGWKRRSQYLYSGGASLGFYTLDATLDWATGLLKQKRSASGPSSTGLATDYLFDKRGRLTGVRPLGHGAWTEFLYSEAAGSTPPQVDVIQRPNGLNNDDSCDSSHPALCPLARQRYQYDLLGRLAREMRLLPNTSCGGSNCWNKRVTEYDAMGRTSRVSEVFSETTPDADLSWTLYSYCDPADPTVCDPFGRVRRLTPPDGAGHAVDTTYTGNRVVTRKVKVATGGPGDPETETTTTQTYDGRGHLVQVTEPSDLDANGNALNVMTTYTYDMAGRLRTVKTPIDAVTSQTRTFDYDGRGFLTAETQPEKGAGGNGTVAYSLFDPRGHNQHKLDGVVGYLFHFDEAERLLEVWQANPSDWSARRVLKEYSFATANSTTDWALGKLKQATMHNYYDDTHDYPVVEELTYGNLSGLPTLKTTTVGPAPSEVFVVATTWNDLGRVASQTYPVRAGGTDPARKVYYRYEKGFLTEIMPYYVSSITYHPNGIPSQVVHGRTGVAGAPMDGVVDSVEIAADHMARPIHLITTGMTDVSGAAAGWSSGVISYDGSGNIRQMAGAEGDFKLETDWFSYDGVGRLREAHLVDNLGAEKTQKTRFDRFGNIDRMEVTGRTTLEPAIDHATNRLGGVSYDSLGNQASWGGLTYEYDPLSQLRHAEGTGINTFMTYTAEGERVSTTDHEHGTEVFSLRGLDGRILREFTKETSTGAWDWKDYVWGNGALLASAGSAGGISHYHLDHLGSTRVVTNRCGQAIKRFTVLPFGLGAVPPSASEPEDSEHIRFTGHERDTFQQDKEGDTLDYMHTRYYGPAWGRFLGVDAFGGSRTAPQSWNRYTYANNNPLRIVDPNGLYGIDFHQNLTYYLAVAAGNPRAATLAANDQLVDEKTPANPLKRRNFQKHFMSREKSLQEFAAAGTDPKAQGRALHSVQDSFSHAGYCWPIGHGLMNILGLSPDDPWRDIPKAMEAAALTFQLVGGRDDALDKAFLRILFSVHSESERSAMALEAAGRTQGRERGDLTIHTDRGNATMIANYYRDQGYTVYIDGIEF